MGFDACTQSGGRLIIFQFKASNHTLKSGARRFHAPHNQMVKLQSQCKSSRSVFYVFPLIGTTLELSKSPDILKSSWLLDVTTLPSGIVISTTTGGSPRKNGMHYVDVVPNKATIHSDPFDVILTSSDDLYFDNKVLDSGAKVILDGNLNEQFDGSFNRFWEFRKLFSRNAVGVVLLD